MDVDELQILMASVVLLYEDHLKSNGHISSAKDLARGMRMMRESVSLKSWKCARSSNAKPL